MADDPNRDILPVKEGSCADTIISGIDPRERHLVCKLDRYQLEDKYLRLLDEASNLKKLSNCQEDKIKRLGTKLIRLASNPRSCGLALDVADDRSRTAALELENTKLKEKITVMRNQLLSHTMNGRSSSRSRNLVRPTSSGFVTCRSENNRTRVPSCPRCIVGAGDDDNDMRNCLLKIEKLEAQKKDMTCRITELEKELALSANTQREKVAENVEYIRVWRQMKQLNDKLMTAQEKNAALTAEINDLKTTLEQTTKNNQEIAAILMSERTRITEIDHHMLKAKNSELTLREKDEQIRDFMSEIKILQQHNNELISLTSKYSQVEFENIELRKKLSENAQDQQTLKTTFNNEQANIVTLKATNERLLAKLQELQTNIDTLTVQVTSFHKQNGKCDAVASEMTLSDVKQCMKCCEMYDKIMQLEEVGNTRKSLQLADKSIQTIIITASIKEQNTMKSEEKRNEEKASLQSPLKERKTGQETNGTNVLSREKILKLLDQAQINTPLDASRITSKEEYTGILDVAQRHSDGEISSRLLHDELNPESSRKGLVENQNITLNQMFLMLFDILQEYMSFSNADEKTFSSHQVSTIKNPLIDVNNNNLSVITTRGIKQNCLSADTAENLESDCRCALQLTAVDTKDCRNLACEKKSATVLMKDTCSSMKAALDVNLFPKIHEKCRKSSYRDISKDFCAEKTVQKLKRLKSPRCNLTCHFRKMKDPLSLEKQKLPCRIECLDDNMKLTACPTECFPLLISDSQGLIEIHISRLQLSTSVAKIPEEEDICNLYIYISWDIWGEKTAYTPRMKCPNLIFNSSSVYRIANLSSFFKNVLSEYLVFRVNIVRRNDTSYTLARAKVSIKDILDYPQNKLHYIVPVSSVISCFFGVNFGQLSLWVRLSCNVDMVEAFKKQCGITSLRDVPLHVPSIRKDTNDVPQENFVPHPSVKATTFEDIRLKDQDLKDRTIHEESRELHIQPPLDINFEYETENSEDENYYFDNSNNEDSRRDGTNRISEEDKRITAKCPDSNALTDNNDVETQKQKRNALKDSSSMKEFRTLIENHLIKDTIIIEIASMQLLNESFIMQDDDIHLLYVEYSFLGRRGEDMETVSVKKSKTASQEMFYNFKKKFRIDEKTHSVERNILRSMLAESTSPNVKFIIISEPLPEETEVKECEEVGYAIFNIKKYALGDGCRDVSLPIKDDRNRQIGTLKIVVSGFDAIRQCLSEVKAIKQLE